MLLATSFWRLAQLQVLEMETGGRQLASGGWQLAQLQVLQLATGHWLLATSSTARASNRFFFK